MATPIAQPLALLVLMPLVFLALPAPAFAAGNNLDLRPPSCAMAPGMSATYPQAALDANIFTGSVALSFLVSPTGQIHDVKIESSSDPVFEASALSAVGQLHCDNPANIEMPTHFTVEFRFTQPH